MAHELLSCQNLTMRFGGLTALDGVDFSIGKGRTVGLVGPNGSGKTTFFNVVTGLYKPSAGVVTFEGEDVFSASPQRISLAGISRTFQRARLMLDQTLFDNVAVGLLSKLHLGLTDNLLFRKTFWNEYADLKDRVGDLIHRFNPQLAGRIFEPVGALSMIDRRRVEICRALIGEPKLLLLDEPSAGMTHEETRRLMDEILMFRDEMPDLAIILVEHEMDVVRRVSEICVVLNFGRKIFEGTFDDLIADPTVQTAYLGESV
ncbi:MAG: ABC transporter ATP-binding protein [Bradyrhizobiaceae bacterium]|nr:MAG: ABC transporter ATP-binding protein [Bradyrhizobiaceae bacterium]